MRTIKYFHYDLETTGTDVSLNGIHQIAAIIDVPGYEPVELNYKVRPKPGCFGTQEAYEVCGVTAEELRAYPPMEEAYRDLLRHLDDRCDRFDPRDKFFQVGYNIAGFDSNFLRQFFHDNGNQFFGSYFWPNCLDVMVMASVELMEKRPQMVNFKLHTVAEALGFIVDESLLHDAMYDVQITKEMFEAVMANRQARVGALI